MECVNGGTYAKEWVMEIEEIIDSKTKGKVQDDKTGHEEKSLYLDKKIVED